MTRIKKPDNNIRRKENSRQISLMNINGNLVRF